MIETNNLPENIYSQRMKKDTTVAGELVDGEETQSRESKRLEETSRLPDLFKERADSTSKDKTSQVLNKIGVGVAALFFAGVGFNAGSALADSIQISEPTRTPTYASHDSENVVYFDSQSNQIPTIKQPIPDAGAGRYMLEGSGIVIGAGASIAASTALSRRRAENKAREERNTERMKRLWKRQARR